MFLFTIPAICYDDTLGAFLWGFGSDSVSDLRSLESWCIKGTDEPVTRVDSSVLLMHHDPDPDNSKGMHSLSLLNFVLNKTSR